MDVKKNKTTTNKSMKVLIADQVDENGIQQLKELYDVHMKFKITAEELENEIAEYHALVVRSRTQVSKAIINRGVRLRVIARAGVGVDNVDVEAASEKGIYVINSPSGNTVAAAELTLGMILSVLRSIPQADASIRKGLWIRSQFMGYQLQKKCVGIIGLGQVGSYLAKILNPMQVTMLCYDPFVNDKKAKALNCEIVSLNELLSRADIITIHIPLTNETENLINKTNLKFIKPTSIIINCARGGIIDEEALVDALNGKKLAGAALDVFQIEKPFPLDSPILNCPNLVLTPHIGASTEEAQYLVAEDVSTQISAIFENELPMNAVNLIGIGPIEMKHLKDQILCTERLGSIASQALQEAPTDITLTVTQHQNKNNSILLNAAATGVLKTFLQARVNLVNIEAIIKSEKINLKLVYDQDPINDPQEQYPLFTLHVSSLTKCISLSGTIDRNGSTFITAFNTIPLFLPLPIPSTIDQHSIYLLCVSQYDRPGTMFHITQVLASNNINIANCHLGRLQEEKEAVCFYHLDSVLSKQVLSEISKCPNIINASFVMI